MKSYHIISEHAASKAINEIASLSMDGRYEVIVKKTCRGRSSQQNRSLHLYLRMMAEAFNDAGMDQQMVIEKFKCGFSIPVTTEFLKEVFRVVMSGMFKKKSTADLTTTEIQAVYDTFNNGMGQKYGISRPWPHVDK